MRKEGEVLIRIRVSNRKALVNWYTQDNGARIVVEKEHCLDDRYRSA